MESRSSRHRPVAIEILTRPDCRACERLLQQVDNIQDTIPGLEIKVVDISKNPELQKGRQSYITPSLWVNDELWYLGDIPEEKFRERLMPLTHIKTSYREDECLDFVDFIE